MYLTASTRKYNDVHYVLYTEGTPNLVLLAGFQE